MSSNQQIVPLTALPALSSSALAKVKNNDNYIAAAVLQCIELDRNAFGEIDGARLRRDLRSIALINFGIYIGDYHATGYPMSQSLYDLISEELCATLTLICRLCLSASDIEDEIKTSIQGFLHQQYRKSRQASSENPQSQFQGTDFASPNPLPEPTAAAAETPERRRLVACLDELADKMGGHDVVAHDMGISRAIYFKIKSGGTAPRARRKLDAYIAKVQEQADKSKQV